jgi:hemerythrin-like domain-containing protein
MLSAQSAWRILQTEHDRIRELVSAIDRANAANLWRYLDPQRSELRRLVHELQTFEDATHRPKGELLLAMLRGRAPEADRLLDELDIERSQSDRLLARAFEILEAPVARLDAAAADECAEALRRYRDLELGQLEREDTLLRSYTAQLMTADEWSRIVSSMSAVLTHASGRPQRPPRT